MSVYVSPTNESKLSRTVVFDWYIVSNKPPVAGIVEIEIIVLFAWFPSL